MPKLFDLPNGYIVYIWTNEDGEAIHVHIGKRRPSKNDTKLWLCSDGTFLLADKTKIPSHELRKIINTLNSNVEYIMDYWKFLNGYIKFYR